jgi:hypothetical protein
MLSMILNYIIAWLENLCDFFFTKKVIVLELENEYYLTLGFIYKYFTDRGIFCQRAENYFLVTMTKFQSLLYCWKLRYIERYWFKVYINYTEEFLESIKLKIPYYLKYDIELIAQ